MRSAVSASRSLVRSPRQSLGATSLVVCGALVALPLCGAAARAQGADARPGHVGAPAGSAFFLRHREAFYVSGAAAGVAANAVWHYHPGSRVGQDLWLGRDKALHAGAASSLTFGGIGAGVRPWFAAATVCAAGGAFELTQVRASARDASVNCASAAMAWGWTSLVRRYTHGGR